MIVTKEEKIMKIGILTSGGEAPGINAVVRAIVRKASQDYASVTVGIKDRRKPLSVYL